jgi:hypothetical protein
MASLPKEYLVLAIETFGILRAISKLVIKFTFSGKPPKPVMGDG